MKNFKTPIRSITLIAMLISFMACVASTKKGHADNTDIKDLTGFKNISFNISGDLMLKQGSNFSVKIEAEPADLEEIVTIVEDQTLVIKTKPGWHNLKNVKVYVTMPVVEGLAVAGSGNINANEPINTGNINLSVAGSGNINLENLVAEQTESSIAGSGNINIKGTSGKSLQVSIAGSGDINCEAFESKDVNVSIAGSGSAKVFANENLSTSIVGSGDVYYKGRPLVNANSTGSGSTKPL
jgi:hypothetical protein